MKRFYAGLTCIWLAFMGTYAPCDEEIEIDHAYYRKVHSLDSGSVYVYLKNLGAKTLQINKVLINDKELKLEACPNEMIKWFMITPPAIAPGKISELVIKFTAPPKQLIKVELEISGIGSIKRVVQPLTPELNMTNISFSKDLGSLYITVQNNSPESHSLKQLYLDNQEVTSLTEQKQKVIPANEKGLYIVRLQHPLVQGDYVAVKAIFDQELVTEALNRVFHAFPISSWDGDTRGNLNFDPYPFRFNYFQSHYSIVPKDNPAPFILLMDHPNCLDREKNQELGFHAKKVIKRKNKSLSQYPLFPTLIYGCEYQKPAAYFVYGEIADAFLVNPYEVVFHNKTPKDDGCFTGLGKLACEPKPLLATPAAFFQKTKNGANRFLKADELADTVFYMLGEGAKGIIYFNKDFRKGNGYSKIPGLELMIKKINKMLQDLKEYLVLSEPAEFIEERKDLNLYALLCADKAIIVIALVKGRSSNADKSQKIKVNIPAWFEPHEAYFYTPGDNRVKVDFERRENSVFLDNKMYKKKRGIFILLCKDYF